MNEGTILQQIDEPLMPDEVAFEAAADAQEPVDEQMQHLADYFAGALSPEEADAVQARLNTDGDYVEWAEPLLSMRRLRTPAVEAVTQAEVNAIIHRLRHDPHGTGRASRKERLWKVLRELFTVAFAVFVLVWSVFYLGGDKLRPKVQRVAPTGGGGTEVARVTDFTVNVTGGGEFTWRTLPDSEGVFHATLDGAALLTAFAGARGLLHVRTPVAEVRFGTGSATVDATDPTVTRVTLSNGRLSVAGRKKGTVMPYREMVPGETLLIRSGADPELGVRDP